MTLSTYLLYAAAVALLILTPGPMGGLLLLTRRSA